MSFSAGESSQKQSGHSFYDPGTLAQQQWGVSNTADFVGGAGQYQPFSGQPLNTQTNYAAPTVTSGSLANTDMSKYMNPYTNDVVNTSLADLEHQRQVSDQQAKSEATQAGAWGGDGASVLRGLNNDSYARAAASTSAGLRSQGYTQAQGAAQQDIASALSASMANQGANLQAAGLNSANQQANYGANWQQYLNSQQYPLALRQLLNQSIGTLPTSPLSTSSGSGSGFDFGIGGKK